MTDNYKLIFIKPKDKYHFLVLCVFVLVFIFIKFCTLNTPFFWDEAWVYGPAIREMAKSGIGILPHALSDGYSRGHPLLFFTTGAMWVKLFGSSFFSMHLFALTIATAFIFTLFFIVKNLFDATLALIVASITLVQPIFWAQSALVLPEIFLTLWTILTIYHFVRGNSFFYFLFSTLLVLTKESGVVIIAALIVYQSFYFFTQKITMTSLKEFLVKSLIAFCPLFLFIIFLLVQHYQRGYYMFPEHIALLNFNWHDFQERLKNCYDYMFEHQERLFLTWSFLIAFAVFYKPIPLYIRLFIIGGLITCVKVFFRYWPLPDWLMIFFIGVFTSAFYYFMHIKYAKKDQVSGQTLTILFITGVLYLVFTSINFFTNRYLFLLIPLMILYFSYYIKESLRFSIFLPYIWGMLLMSVTVYSIFFYCNNLGDDCPKYIQGIRLEEQITNYLEDRNLQNDTIDCAFTMSIALKKKDIGFLSGKAFTNVLGKLNRHTKYVVFTNVDYDSLWVKGSDTLAHFRVIKKFNCGIANGKVFERISPNN